VLSISDTQAVKLPSTYGLHVETYCRDLQTRICNALEEIDQSIHFAEDSWERPGGGGGLTRVCSEGEVIERGGVNTSAVSGVLPESPARDMGLTVSPFFATGVSLVLHPRNPYVPTVHMNLRYFETESGEAWFGGGVDLTPYYLFEDDIRAFHGVLKAACDRYGQELYPRYKTWCDEYFYIKHRQEGRGVGGIFFDKLRGDRDRLFSFVKEIGESFLPAYVPIVERRMNQDWGERERAWQLLRRGRYVEFNLMYDKGTVFGLDTNGRVESILMSLPPIACWDYDFHPGPASPEAALTEILKHPRSWT
jgi:coproporphyrinogen III oxidase